MCAVPFPCLIPSRYKQKLEFLEQDMKSLQLKSKQMHEQDYLAAKVNFFVLIILALVRLSPFGAFISKESAGIIMMASIVFTKPVINFFKPIK